jgi:hypothetical protein
MSRVHDMGGQTGFGPVPVNEDGTVAFSADGEASISPVQPSRLASAMRSCRLARISSGRPRWSGSGLHLSSRWGR